MDKDRNKKERKIGIRKHFGLVEKNSKTFLRILSCKLKKCELGATTLRISISDKCILNANSPPGRREKPTS